jgi:putative acetyltransferase
VTDFSIAPAALEDMQAVAQLHRHVRTTCLPYVPDLHTPAEDLAFFRDHVFPTSRIWLAKAGGQPVGFAAVKPEWLDHLYVDPSWHGKGIGRALLETAKQGTSELNLWTFQMNTQARRFYERQGFILVETTDGAANEERLADARYRWKKV